MLRLPGGQVSKRWPTLEGLGTPEATLSGLAEPF